MTTIEKEELELTKGQLEIDLIELSQKVETLTNYQTELVGKLTQMNINYIAVLSQIDSLIKTVGLLHERDDNTVSMIRALIEFNQ
jgi:hypothetical protein